MRVANKIKVSTPAKYRYHLPKALWYIRIRAAELYCVTSRAKAWYALRLAIMAWPIGALLTARTYYMLSLCLGERWRQCGAWLLQNLKLLRYGLKRIIPSTRAQ